MSQTDDELREQIKDLINSRPYYICKRSDDHHDLQSQIGPMTAQYSRKEDRINEGYLEDKIMRLFRTLHIQLLEGMRGKMPKNIKKFDYDDAAWNHGYNDAATKSLAALDAEIARLKEGKS